MKKVLQLATILMFQAVSAWGYVSTAPITKDYHFKYNWEGKELALDYRAQSWEDAFKKAADACFRHYSREAGGRLSEDTGLDIIDVCANPRS